MLFHQLYQPLLVVALSSALLSWVLFLIAFIGQSMALAFILIPRFRVIALANGKKLEKLPYRNKYRVAHSLKQIF